jgi:hypothetical protein
MNAGRPKKIIFIAGTHWHSKQASFHFGLHSAQCTVQRGSFGCLPVARIAKFETNSYHHEEKFEIKSRKQIESSNANRNSSPEKSS